MITFEAFNDINEVKNIKLQIGNRETKTFHCRRFFESLNIFGQFLMRAFESRS